MYSYTSIEEYHKAIAAGTITCSEAVTAFLTSIDEKKQLNAFIEVYREEALARAAALDKKHQENKPKGKLFGVVVGIKDVIC